MVAIGSLTSEALYLAGKESRVHKMVKIIIRLYGIPIQVEQRLKMEQYIVFSGQYF